MKVQTMPIWQKKLVKADDVSKAVSNEQLIFMGGSGWVIS